MWPAPDQRPGRQGRPSVLRRLPRPSVPGTAEGGRPRPARCGGRRAGGTVGRRRAVVTLHGPPPPASAAMVGRFDGRTAGGSAVHDDMNGHPNGRAVANGYPVGHPVGHPVGQLNGRPVGHPVGQANGHAVGQVNGLVDGQAVQQAQRQRLARHALLHRLGALGLGDPQIFRGFRRWNCSSVCSRIRRSVCSRNAGPSAVGLPDGLPVGPPVGPLVGSADGLVTGRRRSRRSDSGSRGTLSCTGSGPSATSSEWAIFG